MKDFAAICQFMNMFHPAFALDDFETEVNLILPPRLLSIPTWHRSCAPSLAVDRPEVMLQWNKRIKRSLPPIRPLILFSRPTYKALISYTLAELPLETLSLTETLGFLLSLGS